MTGGVEWRYSTDLKLSVSGTHKMYLMLICPHVVASLVGGIRKQKTDKILLLNNDICREMIGSYDDKDNNKEGALPRVSF